MIEFNTARQEAKKIRDVSSRLYRLAILQSQYIHPSFVEVLAEDYLEIAENETLDASQLKLLWRAHPNMATSSIAFNRASENNPSRVKRKQLIALLSYILVADAEFTVSIK